MSGHVCYFEAIHMLFQNCICHMENVFCAPVDEDFFLVLIHTFIYILTKFQLYSIMFRVKPPEPPDYIVTNNKIIRYYVVMWCVYLFDLDMLRHVFLFQIYKNEKLKKQGITYLMRVIV